MGVAVVGDAMIDVAVQPYGAINVGADVNGSVHHRIGGGALTTARLIASHDIATYFVGSVGSDSAGERILEALASWRLHPHVHQASEKPTGHVVVIVDADGERTMISDVGANADIPHQLLSSVPATAHVHISGYWLLRPETGSLTARAMVGWHAEGRTISVGMAPSSLWGREHSEALKLALTHSDLVFANADEAHAGQRQGLTSLSTWIVTHGHNGAAVWPEAPTRAKIASSDKAVNDTTGAGDAFAAGFLSTWLMNDHDIIPAIEAGQVEASRYLKSRVGDPQQTADPKE